MSARILIADDQPDVRLLLKLLLQTESDYELIGEAESPSQAMDLVRSLQPDAVVLDQSFNAEVSGLEIAPQLREAAPNMKILLFTAYEMSAELPNHPAVDDFVLKTESFEVVPTLQRLLSAR